MSKKKLFLKMEIPVSSYIDPKIKTVEAKIGTFDNLEI